MGKEYPYTFNEWMKGECGEVKTLTVEDIPGYQSQYLFMFNHITNKGWKRMAGRWVSPREPFTTYGDIQRAFGAQRLFERLYEESTD